MMTAIAILVAALLAQYAFVFGSSYVIYRFITKHGSELGSKREMARFFGGFSSIFVFLALLARQLIVNDSWTWPFIAPVWVITIFVAHDLALGLVIKNQRD